MNVDLAHTPLAGHFAAVNGMQMYYEVYGKGAPLLLLHGFEGSTQQWHPFIGEFAKYFRVIVPDLRGHGRSLDPTNHFTFAQTASDVFALLDQLGIEHFKAIGWSGGGGTLQYLATQQPARLETIILFSCSSYFPEKTRAYLLEWAASNGADSETMQQDPLRSVRQVRSLVDQVPQIVDDFNAQPPNLPAISAKTLIVFGDRDELFDISMPVQMYTTIPNAYLWIIPNARHDVIGDDADKRALFIHTALAFLQDEW